MKLIIEDRLIALMNCFDALIAMQKSSALSKVPFLKKSVKTEEKKTIYSKNVNFFEVFLDFFRTATLQRAEFFCVVISASKRFI